MSSAKSDVYGAMKGVWLNPRCAALENEGKLAIQVEEARNRFVRFEPVLAALFPDTLAGRVTSPLISYPDPPSSLPKLWIKADHALPITGSIKARGGLHEVLSYVDGIAATQGLVPDDGDMTALLHPAVRAQLSQHHMVVGSTGNLGFSIGIMACALGMTAEVHMSADAKQWKKERLRSLGIGVVEHAGDYSAAVASARARALGGLRTHFVDDERSIDLFIGYATAARELADQLEEQGIGVSINNPLTVYLPCGVGGAPGGILFGLRMIYGKAVRCVFVEPIASACMMAAMTVGRGTSVSVYEYGLDNITVADGLAVARASEFVVDTVGASIDAIVTVSDDAMTQWVVRAYNQAGIQLEPSAAASLAAITPYLSQVGADAAKGTHVAWTTGGGMMPKVEFEKLLTPTL